MTNRSFPVTAFRKLASIIYLEETPYTERQRDRHQNGDKTNVSFDLTPPPTLVHPNETNNRQQHPASSRQQPNSQWHQQSPNNKTCGVLHNDKSHIILDCDSFQPASASASSHWLSVPRNLTNRSDEIEIFRFTDDVYMFDWDSEWSWPNRVFTR